MSNSNAPNVFLFALLSLKPLDIEFMKRLHDKVNVIPLIAKADTLTPEECQLFKKQVFVYIYNMVLEYMDSIFNNEMPVFFFFHS